ncbi:DnaJ C-terminal domain-containing protein [Bosea sp. RAC05]|uniref:DnaJ C-terminal domain-containing protein n=1 Tax=Bosea sp. RAC05 TaxID=1842539 RepID=UPI00083DDA48|nr:J domain-containing protein [Bosea sp. RAC05]AOG04606.1 dnaJ domain protein [Bosea sp. RAC05]
MADDPYAVLGVARDASDKQIRSAYLKLAKTSHPDLNPGDRSAEERFKAINAANDLLSDKDRRARFDRGEIDGAGHERARPGPSPGQRSYRDQAEGAAGARHRAGFGADDDLGDIFSEMFGAHGATCAGSARRRRGQDRHYTLAVPFLDAIRGTTQRLNLPDGGSLDVTIPPGLESGKILRLRGKGGAGEPAGDALIEVEVGLHPLFRREGRDIHLDLPITIREAVLGGPVTVPTISGPVTMTLPPGSDSRTRLRLRGKGVPASGSQTAGDAFPHLRIAVGPPDEALATFLRERTDAVDWDPRSGLVAT